MCLRKSVADLKSSIQELFYHAQAICALPQLGYLIFVPCGILAASLVLVLMIQFNQISFKAYFSISLYR